MPLGYLKVGTTSSGKSIYVSFLMPSKEQFEKMFSEFTDEEYFESYSVFQYLLLREYRRVRKENSQVSVYNILSKCIEMHLIEKGVWNELKTLKGIFTSLDIRDLGKTLTSTEFQN